MPEKVDDISDVLKDASSKKQLVNMIATQLYKYVNASSYDVKSLIMLVAALTLLNTDDDNLQALNTARRLAMSATARTNKKP